MEHGKDAEGQPLTIEAICAGIKGSRKFAQIWCKLPALRDYNDFLVSKGVPRPKRSDAINSLTKINETRKITKKDVEAIRLLFTSESN